MKIILPIIFIALGALLVFLVFGKTATATKKTATPTAQPTDVPTKEQSQQTPPWILLSNATSKYTA